MADNDLQDDDQKGKKSARFKSFEPNTRKFTKTPDEVKPSSSNFQFVEVNNTTIATPSTRKAVRSYVMRKFHREKRAEVSGKTKGSGTDQIWTDGMVTPDISEQPQTVFGGVELSFRIPTQGTQLETDVENTQLTGIDRALSAELSANYCASLPGNVMMIIEPVPPLVTKFPVPQESMRHVHFSITMINKYSVPMTPTAQSGWFTLVTSNTASFHATLLLSLTTQAQIRRIPLPPECFYHSSEAVRHINSTLEDPDQQCSDETINAIATLVMFESFVTQNVTRSVHLDGLETVLAIRKSKGGPLIDDSLLDFVQCVDQHISASNNIPTRLSLPLSQPSQFNLDHSWKTSVPSLPNLPQTHFPFISAESNVLYHRVRQLSLIMSTLYHPRFSPDLQHEYTKGLLILQTQLNDIHISSLSGVEKVWWHTTVLYTFLILRKIPFGCAATGKMVARMKAVIEEESCQAQTQGDDWLESLKQEEREFMMWVCMLGGIASVGRGEMYSWWVELTRRIGEGMDWEEVKAVLRGFAWVEYICEPVCRVFWEGCFRTGETGVVELEEEVIGKGKDAVR